MLPNVAGPLLVEASLRLTYSIFLISTIGFLGLGIGLNRADWAQMVNDAELAETTREELQAVYDAAYAAYERLVEQGVARELARAALPVGAYTEFYWTVNARALMNFVSLRASENAQREIRRYAEAVERLFADQMPITHAAFIANARTAP